MSYSTNIKTSAQKMRKNGVSIIQISKKLSIAKSTISAWTKSIELPLELRKYLTENSIQGREKGLQIMKAKRELEKSNMDKEAQILLKSINFKDEKLAKLIAALVFWCEGGKRTLSCLYFTNSDSKLIKLFLKCLRLGFKIDEKKFRCLMHLHNYHNEKTQLEYWSKATGIPKNQFTKTFLKKHTEIRKRKNYQGCLSVRYYNARVARTLDAIYHAIATT